MSQRLELVLHRVEHLLDAFELAQVGGDGERRRPAGRGDGLGRGREIGLRRRHDHRLRAGLGEIDRDLAADAAAAAGDDHHFSLKLAWHIHSPALLFELSTPRQSASAFSSCTTFFSVPISGTCISNASPALSHFRSSGFWLSLVGVPVAMISPGFSVMKVET